MNGKVVVITGANTGIGKQTAMELARMGATIGMVCRSRERGEAAQAEIIAETGNQDVTLHIAEFASLDEVRTVGRELSTLYPTIDVLINNAGIIYPKRLISADGHEKTFAVNHLAPFLLTSLLLDNLKRSTAGRIVNLASEAHRSGTIDKADLMSNRRYRGMAVYSQSKLANILFTRELAKRLTGTNVTANAVHPGVVATEFGRDFTGVTKAVFLIIRLFLIRPKRGAQTSIYLASSPEVQQISGEYFAKSRVAKSTDESKDMVLAKWLWEESERLIG